MADNKYPPGYVPLTIHELGGGQKGPSRPRMDDEDRSFFGDSGSRNNGGGERRGRGRSGGGGSRRQDNSRRPRRGGGRHGGGGGGRDFRDNRDRGPRGAQTREAAFPPEEGEGLAEDENDVFDVDAVEPNGEE